MKIRAMVVALGMVSLLSGCEGMDNNALLQSGAQAFQAYSLNDAR